MHHLGRVLFTSELNNISDDITDLKILFYIIFKFVKNTSLLTGKIY